LIFVGHYSHFSNDNDILIGQARIRYDFILELQIVCTKFFNFCTRDLDVCYGRRKNSAFAPWR